MQIELNEQELDALMIAVIAYVTRSHKRPHGWPGKATVGHLDKIYDKLRFRQMAAEAKPK